MCVYVCTVVCIWLVTSRSRCLSAFSGDASARGDPQARRDDGGRDEERRRRRRRQRSDDRQPRDGATAAAARRANQGRGQS